MNYTLDTSAAKQADNITSRIDTSGKYLGVITRAEPITSKKGTKGVDMSFKSDTGATSDYLTLWTHNGEGKQLQGFNTLMAIMACLKTRELNASEGSVEKYDQEQRKRITVITPVFKELMHKPFGLLIYMEEYQKNDGSTAWKPAIAAPFDAQGFTASEILKKATKPETLEKMVQALRDRPLKNSPQGHHVPTASYAPSERNVQGAQGGAFGDMDDDIPFAAHGACGAWRVI